MDFKVSLLSYNLKQWKILRLFTDHLTVERPKKKFFNISCCTEEAFTRVFTLCHLLSQMIIKKVMKRAEGAF